MKCEDCGPAVPVAYDPDTDESVCTHCGIVLDSAGAAPAGGADRNTPTPGRELGGYVGGSSPTARARDAAGGAVGDADGIRRQRRLQRWTMSKGGGPASARTCRLLIGALAAKLSLPVGVRRDAEEMSDRACRLGAARGGPARGLGAAAVLLASRRAGIPRSASEIGEAADVGKISLHYRRLCRVLGTCPPPPNPDLYVARAASVLGLSEAAARAASVLLARARDGGRTAGRSPKVLAAGAVYLAARSCGQPVTVGATAGAAGVSDVSVRNCAAMLRQTRTGHAF